MSIHDLSSIRRRRDSRRRNSWHPSVAATLAMSYLTMRVQRRQRTLYLKVITCALPNLLTRLHLEGTHVQDRSKYGREAVTSRAGCNTSHLPRSVLYNSLCSSLKQSNHVALILLSISIASRMSSNYGPILVISSMRDPTSDETHLSVDQKVIIRLVRGNAMHDSNRSTGLVEMSVLREPSICAYVHI